MVLLTYLLTYLYYWDHFKIFWLTDWLIWYKQQLRVLKTMSHTHASLTGRVLGSTKRWQVCFAGALHYWTNCHQPQHISATKQPTHHSIYTYKDLAAEWLTKPFPQNVAAEIWNTQNGHYNLNHSGDIWPKFWNAWKDYDLIWRYYGNSEFGTDPEFKMVTATMLDFTGSPNNARQNGEKWLLHLLTNFSFKYL